MDPNDVTIQRISSRIVYQNPWMRLREDATRRPDRYPVSHRSWEFPQGTLPNRQEADPNSLGGNSPKKPAYAQDTSIVLAAFIQPKV